MSSRSVIALLALCGSAAASFAQIDDPIPDPITKGTIRIGLAQVATGMAAPNAMTTARDGTGRLFVVDQSGQVELIKNGHLQATPFLDMSSNLVDLGVFGSHDENDYDERGLLGLAFHPGFSDPHSAGYGKFYTYSSEPYDASKTTFTTSEAPPQGKTFDHQSVIAEWSVDFAHPDQADPSSRRELMRIDQPQFNHNGGMLNFGPDGNLYISLGDGGGADDQDGTPWFDGPTWGHGASGNGQDITDVHGSMLRIDPLGHNSSNGQYGVPADNPFVGQNGVDEIYAYGFRNAFRFNFDSKTGDLIVGDVGQNDIEEVDVVRKGENYGWGIKEGTFLFDGNGSGDGFVFQDSPGSPPELTDPVAQYDHDEGIAIVGGFVYRGSLIPELEGKYVFGDFSQDFVAPLGRLFYADLATGEINEFLYGAQDLPLGLFVKGFGQDDHGELYLLAGTNLGPFGNDGTVYRIVPAPGVLAGLGIAGLASLRRRR